ncbi:manganese efflux pump MntP [Clostridium vitabionis]|uniref:manganese efflux pump MntP n=1 Tax=Clostridium vitabionis TaxID=2784388 RepID=UPI00188AE4CC|nr:manganese efflux pump [Clostridium vitabionis]
MNAFFIANSALLGVGLAMDAFSVSMANGLREPTMGKMRMSAIAGTYGFFQWLMPMLGWVCVHTVLLFFTAFQKFIPWIALLLLAWIGGKMLLEGLRGGEIGEDDPGVSFSALMMQGIATSIDALSVGFTIAGYSFPSAFVCSLIIAVVTFIICIGGLIIGRTVGTKLSGKAAILGGIILIGIGLEIFLRGVL